MGKQTTVKAGCGSRAPQVSILESRVTAVYKETLQKVKDQLMEERDRCVLKRARLPHLHLADISIPLIDEAKIHPWRPSRCPEALRPLWAEKKNTYLKSGRWEMFAGAQHLPDVAVDEAWQPAKAARGRGLV